MGPSSYMAVPRVAKRHLTRRRCSGANIIQSAFAFSLTLKRLWPDTKLACQAVVDEHPRQSAFANELRLLDSGVTAFAPRDARREGW